MQSTHKIAGSAAKGFAAYLTSSAQRGDYYVGGEIHGEGGRWHGSPDALATLGLDRDVAVRRSELVALMDGYSPRSGDPIRAVGGDGSRVAGIDLTFSAPKSVSALWALSGPYRRAQIEVAHRRAVASAVGRIERDVELVRRRMDGELRWERARSLVAAEFVHTSSRLTRDQERDGVPDPQLHSHVLVLAAERGDGSFGAVDSRELYRSARVNGAWYRAELAWELGELGVRVRGRTGRDGKYFEVPGVPEGLVERWSRRSDAIERAAREFRDRYGRAPRGGELGALTVATRGTKTVAASVDVSASWRAVGEEYGLGRDQIAGLFSDRAAHEQRDTRQELLADVTSTRALVERRELDARALELAAGAERPARAIAQARELERTGELVALEGGGVTTRELRRLEQQTLAAATARADDPVGVVSREARERAADAAEQRIGSPLTAEQREALATITGPGGVIVLVGEAGTGKGAVLDAARDAWEQDGHRVIGTAVAGAAAQRLGHDTGIRETMTADAMVGRLDSGRIRLDERSVVVFDEAGMADTRRLAALVERTHEANARLVLAGDSAQLSPLGAGGMFPELARQVPTARLSEVHRARHEWERDAWGRLRDGDAHGALAQYQARGRLHLEQTRTDAGERMVNDWAATRQAHPGQRVVMLTDASNAELDRLNKHAQELRAAAGELGQSRVALPDRPYGLAAGDEILFAKQHPVPSQERIENGTHGLVLRADERDQRLLIRTDEPKPRDIDVSTRDFDGLRLAYAQHVYKAQGLTADRALVLTGGWQSDRERAYVAVSRAREQTDIYAARDDLDHHGIDPDAIAALAERISESHAQQASITHEELPTVQAREPRESPDVRELTDALAREHSRGATVTRDEPATADTPESAESRAVRELRDALAGQREHPRDAAITRDEPATTDPGESAESRAVRELRDALAGEREQPRGATVTADEPASTDAPESAESRAVRELRDALAGEREQPRGATVTADEPATPDLGESAERRAVRELREALAQHELERQRERDRGAAIEI